MSQLSTNRECNESCSLDRHFSIGSSSLKGPRPINRSDASHPSLRRGRAVISVTSEALLTTTDTKLTKVDFGAGPSQRFLRIHHKTKEAEDEYEDRILELGELKSLKARGFTKEAYAKHLGIDKELEVFKKNLFYNDMSYVAFAQTTEFKKYQAYQDFLRDLKKAAQAKKKPQGCCIS